MSKLSDVVSTFNSPKGTPKEYAKEVKVAANSGAIIRFIAGSEIFVKYNRSWIPYEDDTAGKIGPFITWNEKEGISLLGEMFGEGKYFQNGDFETKKTSVGRVITYQAKDPELYKAMTEYWNPAYQGMGTAKPKLEAIFNVIHRNPELIGEAQEVWCVKEKHTKVLRLGPTALAALDGVETNDGDIREYDINYTKQGAGKDTVHGMRKAGAIVQYQVAGLLTAEELAYATYDLEEVTELTSAYSCLKHIPTKIKRMDAAMGTNFYARFEKQAEKETAEYEKMKAASPANAVIQNPFDDSNIPVAQAPTTPAGSPAVNSSTPVSGPIPSRRVKATPTNVAMTECFACHKQIPVGSVICPECSMTLLEPCSECNNLFSVNEKECPVCHTIFN